MGGPLQAFCSDLCFPVMALCGWNLVARGKGGNRWGTPAVGERLQGPELKWRGESSVLLVNKLGQRECGEGGGYRWARISTEEGYDGKELPRGCICIASTLV